MMNMKRIPSALALGIFLLSVTSMQAGKSEKNTDFIILGGGCFWCVEALYETLDGVIAVESGYAGGSVPNPTYREVCSGTTGHAEVIKVTFDPETIDLESLLGFFWQAHDPTTLNRQGADVGTQYRSIILYRNEEQKRAAEASMKAAQPQFSDPIVTEISGLETFYPAEDYHQDYYRNNKNAPYCRFVIAPKLKKLES
jgi:peptide-methionine (S)-S-oxide reductase